jgi:hypothetical protein
MPLEQPCSVFGFHLFESHDESILPRIGGCSAD